MLFVRARLFADARSSGNLAESHTRRLMPPESITRASPGGTPEAAPDFPPWGRLAYVDGVRAIAILAVIGFHAHIPGFRGGFVGVDVFFVISGFLITHQIVSQLLTGRFSAAGFYARRMLRILPPLLLVTVVTMIIGMLFPLLPQEGRELAMSGAATAAMISNYYFSNGGNYFSPQTEINPLLHTWSLGVEEQYYLLAPAFMSGMVWLAARRNWDAARALLIGGLITVLISHVTLAILSAHDGRLAFFSIMTRAWQFAVGGMLAIAVLRGTTAPARLRPVLGALGLLAIVGSVVFYNEHIRYPGIAAGLLPTLGTLLLLESGLANDRAPLVRLLESRPFVAIGVLSYSWYLWHWPLTELMRSLPVGQESIWKDIAASSVALLLSVPTYLLLERPMKALRRPEITRPYGARIVAAGIGGSALVAVAALLLARSPAYDRNLQAIPIGAPTQSVSPCRSADSLPRLSHVKPCAVGATGAPSVLVLGDSHALMLKPVAEWSATAAGKTAVVLGLTTCPPLQGVDVAYFSRNICFRSNDEILEWVRYSPQARSVAGAVLAARWSFYNGEDTPAGEAALPRLFWTEANGLRRDFSTIVGHGLTDLITTLGPTRRVLIVGPTPELKHPIENCLQRAQLTGQPNESCAIKRSDVELRHRQTWQVLRNATAKFPNVRLIDPVDVFCDRATCWPYGPKGLYYLDKDHLSGLATEMLYRHFEREFRWVYGDGPAN
jgi:peptidoglycan/LPS O-acetylase OafA/YrhL